MHDQEHAPGASVEAFDPPGPGTWMLDTTHHGRRPVTTFYASVSIEENDDGFAMMTKRFGLPLETMQFAQVNGFVYSQPKAVGAPENAKSAKAPPKPLLWLIARLHPEMRRRNATAKTVFRDSIWREDVDAWFGGERQKVIDANLTFQGVDLAHAADRELADHVEALGEHLRRQFVLGFATHGGDIVPTGDFLAHCASWGIGAGEASQLLAGSSPLTTETRDLLAPVAVALTSAGDQPLGTVDAVRAVSPDVDHAISSWLELHGARPMNSDDVDCPTLGEHPDLQLRVLTNLSVDTASPVVDPAPIRARVPLGDRATFDRLLADARYGLSLRDDNVGIRLNWPIGLARLALLEAGGRLVGRGAAIAVTDPMHASVGEVVALLRGEGGPGRDELAQRAERHRQRIAAEAPLFLGPPEEPPPLDAFPAPMARVTRAAFTVIEQMQGDLDVPSLSGTGVSGSRYIGRACVIASADDDFAVVQPGDVLVAPFTSPSFNNVFPLLGAVAVQEGGLMSHTAIVSREFDIPAVVGVKDLLAEIHHGDLVEVDPAAGTVRRMAEAAS